MSVLNSVLAQNILNAFVNSAPNPGSVSPNDNLIELCNGLANAIISYNPNNNNNSNVVSVNGYTGIVVLNKADIGLGNVDNTSDLNKPISIATQNALNNKANLIHTHSLSDITQSGASTGQIPQWNGSNWVPVTINTGNVISVNGYTGIVVLNKADIGLGNVDNIQQLPLSYLDIDTLLTANSDTKVPSQKAIKTYVDNGLNTKQNLLGFTPENVANKVTTLTSPNNTTYPTTQAVANDVLYTWTPTSTFTQGQKFVWQAATNDWRTYVVRSGQTLSPGETPFTNPEKVDKINPFSTFSLQYMTVSSGGGVNANGLISYQNFLYDEVNDKYVIAGGSTSDNVLIFTRPNANEIYSIIINVNCGHDVMRVVYINNEYWAINDNVGGTLTITRINAVTNTIIGTFTSTYSGGLNGGYRVRNNKLYYATAQSTVSFFRLYEIDSITLTTTMLINQTTGVGFTYMVWWFDEVNGFICTSTNAGNSFRVYNINTYALIGTYNVPIFTSGANVNSPIYASDGKTYILLGQSGTGMGVFEIDPSNGSPTFKFRIGNMMPTPNNAWQVLYDSSNPDWALFVSNNNILGVAHFVNVLTGDSVVINIPNTMFSQFRYFNKQLEYYCYVGAAGAGTVRQIFRYDFR